MARSNLIVRNYRQEDSSYSMKLYDSVLIENLHFVRNENFLNYFMQYPGVDKDGVLVAEKDGEITGLTIVSITEKGELREGNIIELLAKDATSMRALIQVALNYCKRKNVDYVALVPPPTLSTDAVFKDWIKFEMNTMMTKFLSLPSLLEALLSNAKIRDSYAGKKIGFSVGEDRVEIRVTSKTIDVNEAKGEKKDETIWASTSPQTFLKIIFGQMSPHVAYLTRRVKVQSVKNAHLILKLLRMMQLMMPFYTSLADRL